MLKKQYENTFSNWLKQRQSFLSDKNESSEQMNKKKKKKKGN